MHDLYESGAYSTVNVGEMFLRGIEHILHQIPSWRKLDTVSITGAARIELEPRFINHLQHMNCPRLSGHTHQRITIVMFSRQDEIACSRLSKDLYKSRRIEAVAERRDEVVVHEIRTIGLQVVCPGGRGLILGCKREPHL